MTKKGRFKAISWLTLGAALLAFYSGQASAASTSPPSVTTDAAGSVTDTTATLYADINPHGQQTTYRFDVGRTQALGSDTVPGSAGAGTASVRVNSPLIELAPGTTYYYRVIASNASGQVLGDIKSFQTAKPNAPSAKTEAATAVSYSAATLNGEVDAHGALTTFYFEYGTSPALGSTTSLQSAGEGNAYEKVSTPLSGLTPNTTYYYRLLASNVGGQDLGATKTFHTPAIPLSVTVAGIPNPVNYGGNVTVEGTLAGTEAANHEVILEANPFPYTQGFQQVGNPIVTSSTGSFSFVDPDLHTSTQLRVVTTGSSPVMSSVVQEEVALGISLHAKTTRKPGYVRLYGGVTPSDPGALVIIQLMKGETPIKLGTATISGGGSSFSSVIAVHQSGVYRVEIQTRGENTSGHSNTILLRKAPAAHHRGHHHHRGRHRHKSHH